MAPAAQGWVPAALGAPIPPSFPGQAGVRGLPGLSLHRLNPARTKPRPDQALSLLDSDRAKSCPLPWLNLLELSLPVLVLPGLTLPGLTLPSQTVYRAGGWGVLSRRHPTVSGPLQLQGQPSRHPTSYFISLGLVPGGQFHPPAPWKFRASVSPSWNLGLPGSGSHHPPVSPISHRPSRGVPGAPLPLAPGFAAARPPRASPPDTDKLFFHPTSAPAAVTRGRPRGRKKPTPRASAKAACADLS